MGWMMMPLKRYADFSGRSRRMEFWMWQLGKFLVSCVIWIVFFALAGTALMSGDPRQLLAAGGAIMTVWFLAVVFGLAILVPDIAVAVRRLHDIDRTGWWLLAPLGPYLITIVAGMLAASSPDMVSAAGILVIVSMVAVLALALVLLVFYFLEGTRGPNRFGPDPKGGTDAQVFA
jgi:uncharacterized membrane protein YhaH (DUF805 family)